MKIQIALLTGMIALSTTVSAFACGGSGGYQARGYSNAGYRTTSYGYVRPQYQTSYQAEPVASWQTPAPTANHSTVNHSTWKSAATPSMTNSQPAPAAPTASQALPSASRDLVAPKAPSTTRRSIAVPSSEETVKATNSKSTTDSTRKLTSEEFVALLKLLTPQELQRDLQ